MIENYSLAGPNACSNYQFLVASQTLTKMDKVARARLHCNLRDFVIIKNATRRVTEHRVVVVVIIEGSQSSQYNLPVTTKGFTGELDRLSLSRDADTFQDELLIASQALRDRAEIRGHWMIKSESKKSKLDRVKIGMATNTQSTATVLWTTCNMNYCTFKQVKVRREEVFVIS
jgi:hypothetical protein